MRAACQKVSHYVGARRRRSVALCVALTTPAARLLCLPCLSHPSDRSTCNHQHPHLWSLVGTALTALPALPALPALTALTTLPALPALPALTALPALPIVGSSPRLCSRASACKRHGPARPACAACIASRARPAQAVLHESQHRARTALSTLSMQQPLFSGHVDILIA